MSDTLGIERVIGVSKGLTPNDQFEIVGDSALRFGAQPNGITLGWISQLSLREFVQLLNVTPEMLPRLTIGRSSEASVIEPSRLLDDSQLDDAEAGAIFIVRDDIDEHTALVYEPHEESADYGEVTVLAATPERALQILAPFISTEAAIIASSRDS